MRGITEAVIEEIKARTDLADLIASYGIQVKTAGASRKACCPFHHEKTPSFNINEAKGFYHCFGCGESGDAIKFVQKMEGLTFVEAVRKLAEQCGMKIEEKDDPLAGRRKRLYALMAEVAQFYRRCLVQIREAEKAREYLKSRSLDGEIAEKYLIGYAPKGFAPMLKWGEKHGYSPEEMETAGLVIAPKDEKDRGYHRFGGRLMFSVADKRGRVVAFSGRQLEEDKRSGKYVNSPETPIFTKGKVLFGFDKAAAEIAKCREVIVCEGQIDCIRLQTSGFPNAVAGQGTAFTADHVAMLARVAECAVLVYDDDAAGHKATVKSAGLLLEAGMPVRVVSLPDGEDPDSFLRRRGADEFRVLLEAAESIVSFQVRAERAKERAPGSIDAVNRVAKAVLSTIARSKSAVLKASMMSEAARLMGLPVGAVEEELAALSSGVAAKRPETSAVAKGGADASGVDIGGTAGDGPVEGMDAGEVAPPPPRETALCEFLLAAEGDSAAATVAGMAGEFLPPQVFAHEWTRGFVEAWRRGMASGEDALGKWCESLPARGREWVDLLLVGQAKVQECELSATDIMQDFVRTLWIDRLVRVRGSLAAAGDPAADGERMRISLDLKRLKAVKWHTVKDLVREWTKGAE